LSSNYAKKSETSINREKKPLESVCDGPLAFEILGLNKPRFVRTDNSVLLKDVTRWYQDPFFIFQRFEFLAQELSDLGKIL
jgi:hypothetical protein